MVRVVFVHGACVRDGSWWWHRTAGLLRERGVASVTPVLPSCGEAGVPAGPHGPGLPEDVAAVRAHLEDGDEPTIVVAHSYGGIVVAEAAAGVGTVSHLLLITSYLPEIGEGLFSFSAGAPASFLDVDVEGGTFGVHPEALIETFLQDCDSDVNSEAMTRLARQSLHVTQQAVGASAWQEVPSTYLICTQDRGTLALRQREFARRAEAVVELDAGHHPFLSQPAAVRDLLLNL